MRVLSLCSGYGGLELALSQALPDRGCDLIAVCDNYGPARKVLARHWPEAPQFKDVYDVALNDVQADVVTFGFPCQDLSRAGTGRGCTGVEAVCSLGVPRSAICQEPRPSSSRTCPRP